MDHRISRDLAITSAEPLATDDAVVPVVEQGNPRSDNRSAQLCGLAARPSSFVRKSASSNANTLEAMPEEILVSVLESSAPRERAALALVSTTLHRLASPYAEADVLTMQARRVSTVAGFEAMMGSITALPGSVRRGPMTALADRVQYLPVEGMSRPKAFEDTLIAINGLSPEHRSIPLAALANTLANIYPKDATPAAFDSAFGAMEHVKNKYPVLSQLVNRQSFLPDAESKARAASELLRAIEKMPLHEQARLLAGMPKTVDVVETIAHLPPEHRVIPLTSFMSGIHLCPGPVVIAAIRAVSELPVKHQDKPATTFADRMTQHESIKPRVFGFIADEPTLEHFAQAMSDRSPVDNGPTESCAPM